MSDVKQVEVTSADDGMRLDRWFRQHFPTLTQGQLQKALRKGQIRLDGVKVAANTRIEAGQVVRVPPVPDGTKRPPAREAQAYSAKDEQLIDSLVLFEDEDIIVLNKPSGLAVQGGTKTARHIDGLLPALGRKETPRLTHRLDRDTSGVLVLGKTRAAAAYLANAFAKRVVLKTYWALTRGVPHPLEGRIDLPLEKAGVPGRQAMRSSDEGKKAITDYQVVETAGVKAAFVAARPITGRTHQVRVHLSVLGAPIVGDGKYVGERFRNEGNVLDGIAPKLHLHCREMSVPHPNGRDLTVTAPLTGHMAETWKMFELSEPNELEWPNG